MASVPYSTVIPISKIPNPKDEVSTTTEALPVTAWTYENKTNGWKIFGIITILIVGVSALGFGDYLIYRKIFQENF